MKIETMLDAFVRAHFKALGVYKIRTRTRQYNSFRYGIMRRYIRLQAENARLKADVAFWKLEAQRGEGDDE